MAARASVHELDEAKLHELASRPENIVLRYSAPEGRKEGALPADELERRFETLKREAIAVKAATPEWTDFQIRLYLRRQFPAWKEFADTYPTFFQRATDTAARRDDFLPLHAMIDVQKRLEAGEIESEEAAEFMIREDTMCFLMDRVDRSVKKGPDRMMHERARLRRKVLDSKFADIIVPSEELARKGIRATPAAANSDPLAQAIEHWKQLKRDAGKNKRARDKALAEVTAAELTVGRAFVGLRAQIAERCMGPHPGLDPTGYSFVPTMTRAGQLDLQWMDDWVSMD